MRWAFPVLKSKPVRVLSIIPKLYLGSRRTSPVALPGAVKLTCLRLSTQRCSFKLHFGQRDGSWVLLQRHAEHHDHFPCALDTGVRRIPSKAATRRVGQSTNANGWTG